MMQNLTLKIVWFAIGVWLSLVMISVRSLETQDSLNNDSANETDPELFSNPWEQMDQIESDDTSPIVLIAKPFIRSPILKSTNQSEFQTTVPSVKSTVNNLANNNSDSSNNDPPIEIQVLDLNDQPEFSESSFDNLEEASNIANISGVPNVNENSLGLEKPDVLNLSTPTIDSIGIVPNLRPPNRNPVFSQYEYKVTSQKFTNFRKKFFPKILAL